MQLSFEAELQLIHIWIKIPLKTGDSRLEKLPNHCEEIGFYEHKTYVLKAEHEIEGIGQLIQKGPHTFHIARVIIHPHKRGQGLGERLCYELINEARKHRQIENVTLNVYRHNEKAVRLYCKIGFKEITRSDELNMRMEYKIC